MLLKKSRCGILAGMLLIVSFSSFFAGCAKQEYVKQQYYQQLSSVGSRYLPAKVDILLVVDNSASLNTALNSVQGQLSGFISQLTTNFWDYHVGAITIQNPFNVTKVLVNPTYNTNKLADGTVVPVSGLVPNGSAINDPSSFSILEGTILSNGADYTYTNTYNKLLAAKSDTTTNFLRSDALLVIIVVTNGAEFTVDPNHNNSINLSSLSAHASQLISIKGNSKFIRFYPIASYAYMSGSGSNYCLTPGGTSWPGESYFQMNNYIGGLPKFNNTGETLNFCNQSSLNNVLSSIQNDLNAIKQSYIYSRIVFKEQPIESTIQVLKNGASVKTAAQDPNNGWKYVGYKVNVPTITSIKNSDNSETVLNPGIGFDTGYVIELTGSARMIGTDVPSVLYEKH